MPKSWRPFLGLMVLWGILVGLSLIARDFISAPEQVAVQSDQIREALVARNWIEQKGWTTPILPLYSLNLYRTMGLLQKGPPWPNSERFPGPVVVSAALMSLFGKSGIVAVLLYNLLFHFLALLAIYALALNLFKERSVAFLAGLLFMANPGVSLSFMDGKSGPDLFVTILALIALLPWLRRPSVGRCVLASVTCGIAFLMRYNIGAVFFVTSLIMLAIIHGDRRFPFVNRKIIFNKILYVFVFLCVLSPLFAYNLQTYHKLFFGLNAQLQFPNATRLISYTDPWWKLEGPVRDVGAWTGIIMFPVVFGARFVSCILTGLVGLVLLSSQTYLWPFFGYQVYSEVDKTERADQWLSHPSMILGAVGLLDFLGALMITAPFSGTNGNVYLLWSFIPILIGAAAGAVNWWREAGAAWAERSMMRLDRRLFPNKVQTAVTFIVVMTLLWNAAFFIAHRFRLDLIEGYGSVVLGAYVAVLLMVWAFVAITLYKKPAVSWSCLVLVLLLPIGLKYYSQPYEAIDDPNVFDIPQAFKDIRQAIGPHDVVLTTSQSVFSWFSDRASLGVPEYPELIYSLSDDYRLPVRAIFLYKTRSFVDAILRNNWNYGFSGYSRIAGHFYPIRGFVLKQVYWPDYSTEGPGLLYVRDESVPLASLRDTHEIHFGDPADAVHLIYGWSQAVHEDHRSVAYIFKTSNKKVSLMGSAPEFTAKPASQGEFTFMLRRPFPKAMSITMNSPISQNIDVYLNHDLTYYEGVHELNAHRVGVNLPLESNQWTTLTIPLPPDMLREGLNKVGLSFPDCNLSDLAIKGKSLLKIPGYLFKENSRPQDVILRGDLQREFSSKEQSMASEDSSQNPAFFTGLIMGKKAVSFVCAAVEKATFPH